jgi:septum site-determining protein MinC
MAAVSAGTPPAGFELKNATLPLVSVVLKTADLAALEAELAARLAETPNFFNGDPVVVDLSQLEEGAELDFIALAGLMRRHKMLPVAASGGSAAQMEAAAAAGFSEAPEAPPAPAPRIETVVQKVEVVQEVIREVPAAAPPTVVVDKPLRSGQQVYAKGADLVVLAAVNFGAEVIADGHIHVYAPLRGRAIAGAKGNTDARIFTTCLEPELISIAGTYRTSETPVPDNVLRKPAQVRLVGDRLVMEPLHS